MQITIRRSPAATTFHDDIEACIVVDNGCLQFVTRDRRVTILAPSQWLEVSSIPDTPAEQVIDWVELVDKPKRKR